MATAPFAMMRAARGMSAVITKSPAVVCCAIWSSATSNPPSTITDVTRGEWDLDISWFATRQTGTSRRSEARNTISLMTRGHASASIQIFISISSGALSHAFNSEVDLLLHPLKDIAYNIADTDNYYRQHSQGIFSCQSMQLRFLPFLCPLRALM